MSFVSECGDVMRVRVGLERCACVRCACNAMCVPEAPIRATLPRAKPCGDELCASGTAPTLRQKKRGNKTRGVRERNEGSGDAWRAAAHSPAGYR